jgi:hypothetical protein
MILTVIPEPFYVLAILLLIATLVKFYLSYYPSYLIKVRKTDGSYTLIGLSPTQFEDIIAMTIGRAQEDTEDIIFSRSLEVVMNWYNARSDRNSTLDIEDIKYTMVQIKNNTDKSTKVRAYLIEGKLKDCFYSDREVEV